MGEYNDFYLKSDTLLLADVFESVRKMYLETYQLDPAKFLSAPRLAWQAALKKTRVKLELLTDTDMLIMVKEDIRGGLCHYINRYAKANNKCTINYDKNEESSYLNKSWDVNGFKWAEDLSEFSEDFLKSYNKKRSEGYFLEVDILYPENLCETHNYLPFLSDIKIIDKVKKLVANLHDRKIMLYT